MIKDRMTKKWLKNHMAYSWWKYLLLACACVFCVDMLFSMTAYRVPEDKKVEVYVLNDYVEAERMQQALAPLFFARCPDQEELSVYSINIGSDDMYARMQFTTYAAAHQGDVYLIPAGEMKNLTQEGPDAFVNLAPYIESGVIDIGDIDVRAGMMRDAEGSEGIYAIPADTLYGLREYSNDPSGSLLCLTSYSGNNDNAAQVLSLLIEQYRREKPEDRDRSEETAKTAAPLF